MMNEIATGFQYTGDIPAAIEHIQGHVDAQIKNVLGNKPLDTLKKLDNAYARGESEMCAADYAFTARVNWMPYAQEMEQAQMQVRDIEAVLAGVEWFDEEAAEYLTDYEPPERWVAAELEGESDG